MRVLRTYSHRVSMRVLPSMIALSSVGYHCYLWYGYYWNQALMWLAHHKIWFQCYCYRVSSIAMYTKISYIPMIATTSANMCPFESLWRPACKQRYIINIQPYNWNIPSPDHKTFIMLFYIASVTQLVICRCFQKKHTKCANPGALILHLYGLFVPSDIK